MILFLSAVNICFSQIILSKTNQVVKDLPANFGMEIPDSGVQGWLIPIELLGNSNLGCERVQVQENLPWIALVQRGGCDFAKKVLMMQESGASAVVVGDNRKGRKIQMSGNEHEGLKIPSVFITAHDYEELVKKASTIHSLFVNLKPNEHANRPFLDLIILAFVIPSIMIYKIYQDHF